MEVFNKRISRLCDWMSAERIDAVIVSDAENRRSRNLSYLSGMESDAILIIFADGETYLIAWDIILAEKTAFAKKIIPYTDYDRNFVTAVKNICSKKLVSGRLEIGSATPHVLFEELTKELNPLEVICRADGLTEQILSQRSVKDCEEIDLYKKAGEMTNKLIDRLESGFNNGDIRTEIDAAMLIEAEGRRLGAEGSSFETLAAGPKRSWGIHCVPAYGAGRIGTRGLSIVDCGLKVDGYATDITMTICCGKLSNKQQEMVELVKEAHNLAAKEASIPNVSAFKVAKTVDDFFKNAGYSMPHSLGHGIGLDVHEMPILKADPIYNKEIKPGMLFTIEPGLYDAVAGGVRLENDYLMTEDGAIAITSSRVIYLPDNE